jgi:hypothetical protein
VTYDYPVIAGFAFCAHVDRSASIKFNYGDLYAEAYHLHTNALLKIEDSARISADNVYFEWINTNDRPLVEIHDTSARGYNTCDTTFERCYFYGHASISGVTAPNCHVWIGGGAGEVQRTLLQDCFFLSTPGKKDIRVGNTKYININRSYAQAGAYSPQGVAPPTIVYTSNASQLHYVTLNGFSGNYRDFPVDLPAIATGSFYQFGIGLGQGLATGSVVTIQCIDAVLPFFDIYHWVDDTTTGIIGVRVENRVGSATIDLATVTFRIKDWGM